MFYLPFTMGIFVLLHQTFNIFDDETGKYFQTPGMVNQNRCAGKKTPKGEDQFELY